MQLPTKEHGKQQKPRLMIVIAGHNVAPVLVILTAIMALIAGFSTFWYVRSILPVKNIAVVGSMQYEDSEIIKASGVSKGDRLYKIDTDKVEESLLAERYYLESVSIEKKFPGTLIIRVEEKSPVWYIEIAGTFYILDSDLLVMEEVYNEPRLISMGVPKIILPQGAVRAICGQQLEFSGSEREQLKSKQVLDEIRTMVIKSRITRVNIESLYTVSIVIDNKYDVYLGDAENITSKITEVENVLKANNDMFNDCKGAEIDASLVPLPVTVKKIY